MMRNITDEKLLDYYINKYKMYEIFESNMKPYMEIVEFDKGEDIIVVGKEIKYFDFIVDGKAKIFKELENGKSVLLRFTRPLSELGSMELYREDKTADTNVQALYSATLIRIPMSILLEKTKNDILFHKYIIKRLGHKLETVSMTASINNSYPFKNRFASYLISITRTDSNNRVDEINFDKLTDLATYLGTSYRHLNRVIENFESEGIIKKENKQFIILDYEKLESMTGGFYE
ncbi:cyclic nucleotide-binding domain-containing protein [Acidaminobacter sp. JC074]|uniref:helix-turn-helix domain-containing protein n=1 Tax=Acidaminobacter sp. JC074 TaxID=2530199 RepID=UPI001F0E451F|nr:helix-turn-helix domain-containing protein [Acidaminobacter sp. JC074]MCH4887634.1 cyclic nucleotide-binding domain-containing protein [Acidaminobacter sp. JC074]